MLNYPDDQGHESLKKNLFYQPDVLLSTGSFILGTLILNINVNTFFASQLSPEALAVVGTVGLLGYIPETLVACASYAIQNLSARRDANACHYDISSLTNGLFLALLTFLPISFVMACFPAFTLSLVSQDIVVTPTVVLFFRLFLLGLVFKSCILCLRGFYASRKSNTLFFTVIACTVFTNFVCNIVFLLTPLTVFSDPLLHIGLSHCLAMIVGLLLYFSQVMQDIQNKLLRAKNPIFCLKTCFQLLQFTLPLSIHNLLDHAGTMQIFIFTEKALGLTALASMHLLSGILYLFPGMGFGLTALTYVSMAMGKKKPDYARYYGDTILLHGCLFLGSIGFVMAMFAPSILTWLTNDPQLISQAQLPLQLLFLSVPLHAACQISMKCLQALNLVSTSVTINLCVVYGFRLPAMVFITFLDSPSLVHFQAVLCLERLIKLTLFQYWWRVNTGSQPHIAARAIASR